MDASNAAEVSLAQGSVAPRRVATMVAAAGLVGAFLTGLASPASAVPPSSVEIVDTVDVLDDDALERQLGATDFYQPTDVVVLTLDGAAAENLNEAVLTHARTDRVDWLSADGEKWADGLFILAVDPEGREVGTYFGEDRKLSGGAQENIQDATKEDFRAGRWDAGVVAGVEAAAARIERPWYRSPAPYVLGGFAALLGGTGIAVLASVRRGRRRQVAAAEERGHRHLASVTADLARTEAAARRIPDSSWYGRKILERYRSFVADVEEARRGGEAIAALSPSDRSHKTAIEQAEAWALSTATLDTFDDAVVDAADLLTMSGRWSEAWQRQAAAFRADLDAVPGVVDLEPKAAQTPEAAALIDATGRARVDLSTIGSKLTARQVTPDIALDELQKLRLRVSEHFEAFSDAVTEAYAKTDSEREQMREALAQTRDQPGVSRHSILDATHPNVFVFHAVAFTSWFNTGSGAVEASRSSASSSSYGSSSGGFSGAGSSSSF